MPGPSKNHGRALDGRPVMTLYLSGPRDGIPDMNRSAFDAAARRLRDAGFTVLSLHNLPTDWPRLRGPDPDWRDWLRTGLRMVLEADGVARVIGHDRAATVECQVAHELGIPVRTIPGWLTTAGQTAYMERLRS